MFDSDALTAHTQPLNCLQHLKAQFFHFPFGL